MRRLTSPTGRKVIWTLLVFLTGALTSTATNGFGLSAYLEEQAAEQVADVETNLQPADVFAEMWQPPTDAEVELAAAETHAAFRRQSERVGKFGSQVERNHARDLREDSPRR